MIIKINVHIASY